MERTAPSLKMDAHYESYWENHQAGPPALDPRAPHHHQFRPDPEFVTLCREAEAAGLHVGLDVSVRLKDPKGAPWRDLVGLTITRPDRAKPSVYERIGEDEALRSAASRARDRLEALT